MIGGPSLLKPISAHKLAKLAHCGDAKLGNIFKKTVLINEIVDD
jgi:hypothetical protein